MASSYLPSSVFQAGDKSWAAVQGRSSKSEWQSLVGKATKDYISFLREGCPCSACGVVAPHATRRATLCAPDELPPPPPPSAGHAMFGYPGASASSYAAASLPAKTPAKGNKTASTVDLTSDVAADAPKQSSKKAKAAVVDLTDEDADMVAIYGPSVHVPHVECSACGALTCAACAKGISGGGSGSAASASSAISSHARECPMRFVYAIAGAVERLRRVHLDVDVALSPDQARLLQSATQMAVAALSPPRGSAPVTRSRGAASSGSSGRASKAAKTSLAQTATAAADTVMSAVSALTSTVKSVASSVKTAAASIVGAGGSGAGSGAVAGAAAGTEAAGFAVGDAATLLRLSALLEMKKNADALVAAEPTSSSSGGAKASKASTSTSASTSGATSGPAAAADVAAKSTALAKAFVSLTGGGSGSGSGGVKLHSMILAPPLPPYMYDSETGDMFDEDYDEEEDDDEDYPPFTAMFAGVPGSSSSSGSGMPPMALMAFLSGLVSMAPPGMVSSLMIPGMMPPSIYPPGYAHPGSGASGGKSGGTGYAGSSHDAYELKSQASTARARQQLHDRAVTAVIRELMRLLPANIFEDRSGAAGTDRASDHPLLLQVLLGPGYADGLPVLLPEECVPPAPPAHASAPAAMDDSVAVEIDADSTDGKSPARDSGSGSGSKQARGRRASPSKASPAPRAQLTGRKRKIEEVAVSDEEEAVAEEEDEEVVVDASPSRAGSGGGGARGRGRGRGAKAAAAGGTGRGTRSRASTASSSSAAVTVVSTPARGTTSAAAAAATAGAGAPAVTETSWVPGSAKKLSTAGDGLRGVSVLYAILTDLLRTSLKDAAADEDRRALFFALLQLLQKIGSHPHLAAFLVYTPPDTSSGSSSSSSSSSAAAAAPKSPAVPAYVPWLYPTHVFGSTGGVVPPRSSVVALLNDLKGQASIFLKGTMNASGAPDVLVGSGADDQEFTAVVGLSGDVKDACERADRALKGWGERFKAALAAMPLDTEGEEEEGEEDEVVVTSGGAGGGGAGAGAGAGAAAGKPKRGRKAAATSAAASAGAAAPAAAASGDTLLDPVTTQSAGISKVSYKVSDAQEDEYKSLMADEAFSTMDGLKAQHVYRNGAPSGSAPTYGAAATSSSGGSGSGVGSSSMKRHLKVVTEMASLHNLAVHWASSVWVRAEETSMDLLRAMISGPADTAYHNGLWLFDVMLPSDYPNVPPLVKFLTTGGGTVRVNPNLYAEGKVCLSLLGTWSGPPWMPGVSSLTQVFISIQSQIMNEQPMGNEPGYETRLASADGKRGTARHNMLIRLATIRYAMVEHLKKAPAGFERVVAAHFYLKRDELRAQVGGWVAEAKDVAAYEEFLLRRVEALKAVIDPAYNLEKAAADAAAKAAAEAKAAAPSPPKSKTKGSSKSRRGSVSADYYGHGSAASAAFTPSAPLQSIIAQYTTANQELSSWMGSMSWVQTVFSSFGGIGAAYKTEVDTYCDKKLCDMPAVTAGAHKALQTIKDTPSLAPAYAQSLAALMTFQASPPKATAPPPVTAGSASAAATAAYSYPYYPGYPYTSSSGHSYNPASNPTAQARSASRLTCASLAAATAEAGAALFGYLDKLTPAHFAPKDEDEAIEI